MKFLVRFLFVSFFLDGIYHTAHLYSNGDNPVETDS